MFREDGKYTVDWDEIEKIKKKNIDKVKYGNITDDQKRFYEDYWAFLTPAQRKEYIKKLFPGRTYIGVEKTFHRLNRKGIINPKKPENQRKMAGVLVNDN
jgi:hypothetical protein